MNCDNLVSCHVLNKGKTRSFNSEAILRELANVCAMFEIHVVAQFIRGIDNRITDWLSRWHLDSQNAGRVRESLPGARDIELDCKLFQLTSGW